jgi:hypothetical protein
MFSLHFASLSLAFRYFCFKILTIFISNFKLVYIFASTCINCSHHYNFHLFLQAPLYVYQIFCVVRFDLKHYPDLVFKGVLFLSCPITFIVIFGFSSQSWPIFSCALGFFLQICTEIAKSVPKFWRNSLISQNREVIFVVKFTIPQFRIFVSYTIFAWKLAFRYFAKTCKTNPFFAVPLPLNLQLCRIFSLQAKTWGKTLSFSSVL